MKIYNKAIQNGIQSTIQRFNLIKAKGAIKMAPSNPVITLLSPLIYNLSSFNSSVKQVLHIQILEPQLLLAFDIQMNSYL